jgi:hypothetical protein
MMTLPALAGSGTVAYTGWLGGKLVEEQGEAVKPIIEQQNEAEKKRKRALTESENSASFAAVLYERKVT